MPALAGTAHTVEDIGQFVSLFGASTSTIIFGHVDYADHNPVVLLCPLDHGGATSNIRPDGPGSALGRTHSSNQSLIVLLLYIFRLLTVVELLPEL
jgi:hypothetical protein